MISFDLFLHVVSMWKVILDQTRIIIFDIVAQGKTSTVWLHMFHQRKTLNLRWVSLHYLSC